MIWTRGQSGGFGAAYAFPATMRAMARKKKGRTRRVRLVLALAVTLTALGYGAARVLPEDALAGWLAPVRDAVSGLAASGDAVLNAPGGAPVQVFFAPVAELNPSGLDDHLVALIRGAQDHVLCAFYELSLDAVADALIAAHGAGRRVALVTDSHYEARPALRRCISAGVPVVFDKRSPFMHNKFCVVDGRWVWTGSTNITANGMYRNNNNALLLLSPELAANYALEFAEMFEGRALTKRSPRNTRYPGAVAGGISIECYFAPEDHVEREVVAELRAAERTVDFMAFSFTSEPIAEEMARRMAEGVRVRGVFEARNANSRYCRDDYLRDKGAEIHLDRNKYTMHHKVIVVDGETVVTGSYNFSKSADEKNDENVLVVHDRGIAARYLEEFERLVR